MKEGRFFVWRKFVVDYYSWLVSGLILICSCLIYGAWCPWVSGVEVSENSAFGRR